MDPATSEATAPALSADESATNNPSQEGAPPVSIAPESGEVPTQETEYKPEEQSAPDPVQDEDFARRFNALSRRERQITERESANKEHAQQYEAFQSEKEQLKTNPIDFLRNHGWEFDQLADFVLNDKKVPESTHIQRMQKEIEELRNERNQDKEAAKSREEQQQIAHYKNQIKDFINNKIEDYELINQFGEYDTVFEVMQDYYNKNGVILEVDKAAGEVEKYLDGQLEKAAGTKKFQSRYSLVTSQETAGEPGKPEIPPMVEDTKGPSTLTNAAAATPPAASDKPRHLSDDESKAAAAEYLRQRWAKEK